MPDTPHNPPDRAAFETLLRELYIARASGNLEQLCGLFAPDVVLRISGSSDGKPIAVNARGAAEVRGWMQVLVKTFRLAQYEIDDLLIDGSRAAVHWKGTIHSRVTGASTATELIDLIEIGGDKIRSYIELFVPAG